ncbi:hypothetical protein GGG16DRAFT_119562 [Schizophyllum commune]
MMDDGPIRLQDPIGQDMGNGTGQCVVAQPTTEALPMGGQSPTSNQPVDPNATHDASSSDDRLEENRVYDVPSHVPMPFAAERLRDHLGQSDPFPALPLYGIPLDQIKPMDIAMTGDRVFQWDSALCSCDPLPATLELQPLPRPPEQSAPQGYCYPEADAYRLKTGTAYLRGCYYAAPFNPASREEKRHALLSIATPPETRARWDAEAHTWRNDPILGCLAMPPGIPFVAEIEGDPRRLFTVACFHTLSSLRQYPDRYPRIHAASQELYHIIFGRCGASGDPISYPFFSLPGLRRNDRSGTVDKLSFLYRHNGSFNISSTLMQGQGQGTVLPAEQIDSPESVHILGRMGQLIHELYHLIVPTCVSKLEWEASQFRMADLNVKATGGLEPAATAVQVNVSSAVNDVSLEDVIGSVQGRYHTDAHDSPALWTLGAVFFRLPPNSDLGRFFLARPGLYIEARDVREIYIVFRGTDVHSGFAPSVDPAHFPDWWNRVKVHINMLGPENRCFCVAYLNFAATTRTTDFSISPPLTFGNAGSPALHKERRNNFLQHGYPAMGDFRAYYNNLGREAAYQFYNFCQMAGIKIPGINEILGMMSYSDELGRTQTMENAPFDPIADAARVDLMRGAWKLHYLHAMQYYIVTCSAHATSFPAHHS